VQYPESEKPFGVVYHLHNMVKNQRIRVKSFTGGDNPVFPTATDIFSAANWMERETYDFFGIQFEGHPNLTRILNVDDMDYFPLRKEYPLEDATREDKDDTMFGR
jgi:NADH-quinone oxidoreductase subunit C